MTTATTFDDALLTRLVQRLGVETQYHDIWGNEHNLSEDTRWALLQAMQVPLDSPESTERYLNQLDNPQWLEPVYVLTQAELQQGIKICPVYALDGDVELLVQAENGQTYRETCTLQQGQTLLQCPTPHLDWGYHQLTLLHQSNVLATARLIITPEQCYLPEQLASGAEKWWALALQLYSLKSDTNWGMGDLTDLLNVVDWAGPNGAKAIGLNPLHELFPHNNHHISPYSPSTQLAFNTWYLSPQTMAEQQGATALLAEWAAPEFQNTLVQLRNEDTVNYPHVLWLKGQAYQKLFAQFEAEHIEKKSSLYQAFEAYLAEESAHGNVLRQVATYQALQQHFYAQNEQCWGWPVWPEEYRHPEADAVKQFVAENPRKVMYFEYLQWQVEQQLSAVTQRCKDKGLDIGLYMDMAVGVDRSGAQTWANQSLYAAGAGVGCPPDALNQMGQDWGLPPIMPSMLRQQGYELFIQTLQHNMHYAGALRLDHVMGLYRLFWIPPGQDARSGAYIYYPYQDFMKLIALESHRNQCVVIGEDLGTVAEEMQQAMQQWKMLSYKVLFFEKDKANEFIPMQDYTPVALVTPGTHDLPTLRGFWDEKDIQIREQLHLYPNDEAKYAQQAERQVEKRTLVQLLKQNGVLDEAFDEHGPLDARLIDAVTALLAKTPCYLELVQAEDILEQPEQMNVPGTTNEHPNWRQKLKLPVDQWGQYLRFADVAKVANQSRQ